MKNAKIIMQLSSISWAENVKCIYILESKYNACALKYESFSFPSACNLSTTRR